jgi:hypothetical protein
MIKSIKDVTSQHDLLVHPRIPELVLKTLLNSEQPTRLTIRLRRIQATDLTHHLTTHASQLFAHKTFLFTLLASCYGSIHTRISVPACCFSSLSPTRCLGPDCILIPPEPNLTYLI